MNGRTATVLGWGIAGIAGNRMRLHQVPALIAFLGGLAVFGASGMILGPAILAVTVAVLEVWHARVGAAEAEARRVEEPAPGVAGAWVGP